MSGVASVALETPDPAAGSAFLDVLGLGDRVTVRASDAPSHGFRGFTLSLVVARPGTVDALAGAALEAGATAVKPVAKSFWGYGGVLRGPDGTLWKIASSSKKDGGPATREVDDVVLLLGVADVKASRAFHVGRGLTVAKGFRGYVQFDAPDKGVTLALLKRAAVAKDAGVDPAGDGSHRLAVRSDAGPATDPDGFVWE